MPPLSGAYGMALPDPPVGPDWWVAAPSHWTSWTIGWAHPESFPPGSIEDPASVKIHLSDGMGLYRPRDGSTTLYSRHEPSSHALIHPHFGQTAALHAASRGWSAFHAGAFVLGGEVWALLGGREMGKSSALAWLLVSGFDIFADDLLVVCDRRALAGPRSLDLREGAANHFGIGTDVGLVGTRRRWRAQLGPVPSELPLAGWVLLDWRPAAPEVQRLNISESLAALTEAGALRGVPVDGERLLDLITLPLFRLSRPQEWSSMTTAMEQLVQTLTAVPH